MKKTKIAAGRYEVSVKGHTFFITENEEYSRNDEYRWTAHLDYDLTSPSVCNRNLKGVMADIAEYADYWL